MKPKVMIVLSITQGIEKCIAKWAMAKRLLVAHRSGLAMWAMWAHSLAKAELSIFEKGKINLCTEGRQSKILKN